MNNHELKKWCQHQPDSLQSWRLPLIMGVINRTPDSFSDGGQCLDQDSALKHALNLIAFGADILDIGGESSRPGAVPVGLQEEMDRVLPLLEDIKKTSDICISVDTTKPELMRAAADMGAGLINDINALRSENAVETVAALNIPVCLMHMLGTPENMQSAPQYANDVLDDINDFFEQRIACCLSAGISADNLILDPGFGFGKTAQHNLRIVKYFGRLKHWKLPLMLGVSRKSTLGAVLNKPVHERMIGGMVLTVIASLQGLGIIRTHDVEQTKEALLMMQAVNEDNTG